MSVADEILALEERRFAATTAGDTAALGELFHDELVYTHSNSIVDTKASLIDAIASGRTRYISARRSETKARVYGDAALVTGRVALDVYARGAQRALYLSYLAVWTRSAQGWKFVGWQSTPVPEQVV